MKMMNRLYARHYAIKQLFVSPSDQGHAGVARDRTYLILALKKAVVEVHDPKQVYKDRLKKKCSKKNIPWEPV